MSALFFDSNILIDWLCQRPQAAQELAKYSEHHISRIAWAEVLAGEPPTSRDRVARILDRFAIVEVDAMIARVAANIRHSTRIKLLDALILATAQVNGGTLVTRNTKDSS